MKAIEIRMQIVKNIGNYETVRLEAVYDVDIDNRDVSVLFREARQQLEDSFRAMYSRQSEKQVLSLDTKEIESIAKALKTGRKTMTELHNH